MNLLFSCIGKRGYIADYFRPHLAPGDRIIATSNTPWTPGFRSADKGVLMPSYRSPEYRDAILELCEMERITGILSFMDEDVAILSGFERELKALGVTPILPPAEVAKMCLDKWKAHCFFESNRLATARSFIDLTAAKKAVAEGNLAYPLIVKPRSGFGSANTWVARSNKELEVFFEYQPDMLIQEMLGGDAYNIEILNDLDQRPIAVVPWRKFQSKLGETEQSITVESPELVEYGQKLGRLVGHVGPMDVDLFVSDGVISILELNPRFGGGYPVSQLSGADYPGLIVSMLRGEDAMQTRKPYKPGVAMMKEIRPFGGDWENLAKNDLHVESPLNKRT